MIRKLRTFGLSIACLFTISKSISQSFEAIDYSFGNFGMGYYNNGAAVHNGIEPLHPDRYREQFINKIEFDSLILYVVNGKKGNLESGTLFLVKNKDGQIISSDYLYLNEEIVVNDIFYESGYFYLAATINEVEGLAIKLDTEFNTIWSKRIYKNLRALTPMYLFDLGTEIVLVCFEELTFLINNSGAYPDVNNHYTKLIKLDKSSGNLITEKRLLAGRNNRFHGFNLTFNNNYYYYYLKWRHSLIKSLELNNSIYVLEPEKKPFENQHGFVLYKLDNNLNIQWSDSILYRDFASLEYCYNSEFKINNSNLRISVLENSVAGSVNEFILDFDTNGVYLGGNRTSFSQESGTYNPNNNNHTPIIKRTIRNNFGQIREYRNMYFQFNGQTGSIYNLSIPSSSIYQSIHLNFNSAISYYYHQRLINFYSENNDFVIDAIWISNRNTNIRAQGLRSYKFSNPDLDLWDCEDDDYQVSQNYIPISANNFVKTKNIVESTIAYNYENINLKKIPVSSTGLISCSNSVIDTCSYLDVHIAEVKDTICQYNSIRFTSHSLMAEEFEWYVNGVLVDSASEINYAFSTPGTKNIKLRVYPIGNLSCFKEDSIEVIVWDSPDDLISDTTVCKGDTIQLLANGADSYSWSPVANLSCSNCPNPVVIPTDSIRYIITGTNTNSCSNIDTFYLNVFPFPQAEMSGSNTVCPGIQDVWFGVNPADSFMITWWIDTVGIITQNFGDSVYTTWPSAIDSAYVFAYVQNPAGCDGDTIQFLVKVNEVLEPKIILTNDSICFSDKDSIAYELTYNTNGSIYLWEISNGHILRGDSSSSVLVSWDSLGPGKLKVYEYSTTNIDTCLGLDSINVEILSSPKKELTISGPDHICEGKYREFFVDSSGANSNYEWQALGTDLFIDYNFKFGVKWDSSGEYSVKVNEITDAGCRGDVFTKDVSVHLIPDTKLIGIDTLLCINELKNQIYSVSGFDSSVFNWRIKGGEILQGEGSTEIRVDWDDSYEKELSVTEISEYGCQGDSLLIKQYFDLSQIELFVVSVENDSNIVLDFAVESLRTYPGDFIRMERRINDDLSKEWDSLRVIPKTLVSFSDYEVSVDENSYSYRLVGKNSCNEDLISMDHNSILLEYETQMNGENEAIVLEWNKYQNWSNGVKNYEILEKIDTGYTIIGQTESNYYYYESEKPSKSHCFVIKAFENPQNGMNDVSLSNEVCIELERPLKVPNVVTNNSDGYNDKFEIINIAAWPNHKISIYNRWGQRVFNSENYQNNWPDTNINPGVYYYHIEICEEENLNCKHLKGWLELIH